MRNDHDTEQRLNQLAVQVSATQLLLRSLITCAISSSAHRREKLDELIVTVTKRAALGRKIALSNASEDDSTARLIDELEAAIRREAIKLVADLADFQIGDQSRRLAS